MNGQLILKDIGVPANKETWLEFRRHGIGASEIAIVCGLNPYKSSLQLWAEKTNKIEREFDEDAPLLRFGQLNEGLVRELTGAKLKKPITPVNALYAHPAIEWALASPDAWLLGEKEEIEACAELKTATGKSSHLWTEDHGPEIYECQLQWQLGVLGLPEGYLSCMVGGDPRDIRTSRHKADEAAFAAMVTCGQQFMEHVKADLPPDPGPGDSRLVRELVSKQKREKSRTLSGDEVSTVETAMLEIKSLKEQIKQINSVLKSLKDQNSVWENRVLAALGNAEFGILPDGREVAAKVVTVEPYMNKGYSYVRLNLPK